jgi:hypothetical protein
MTMKAIKPVPNPAAMPGVEADERHQGDVDAFIARNREALNASIRRSRTEVGKGIQSSRTIEEIIADGRKRHSIGS